MDTMFEIMENDAIIKVIGVGGGGGNAVEHMLAQRVEDVDFIVANTDIQALRKSSSDQTIQIGSTVTQGLGAGANPNIGRESALEDKENIRAAIQGADMLFIAAGMGGGTGTGAAPVVAEVAREEGILTVAVVTKPFGFEGKRRQSYAEQGIDKLTEVVDSLITIPNDNLLPVLGKNVTLITAFSAVNDVLKNAVQGIAELITRPGMINVDFADVRTIMTERGKAMMGTGRASGEDRAILAAEQAIASPLLEDVDLKGASAVLVNVTGSENVTLEEFTLIGNSIKEYASESANVITGMSLAPELGDEIKVSIVVTGIGEDERKPSPATPKGSGIDLREITNNSPQPQQPQAQPQDVYLKASQPNVAAAKPETRNFGSSPNLSPATSSAVQQQLEPAANSQQEQALAREGYLDIPAFIRRQSD